MSGTEDLVPQRLHKLKAMSMRPLCAVTFLLLACLAPAVAQEPPPASDRAAIDACLQREKDAPERCIGIVYKACTNAPAGSSTAGMGGCSQRETQIWQDKIDASLKQLLAGSLGKTQALPWNRPPENKRDQAVPGSDIINDMQRSWVLWRAKKCDTLSLQAEDGSYSRVLYGSCVFEETGRHALWLKELVDDTEPK